MFRCSRASQHFVLLSVTSLLLSTSSPRVPTSTTKRTTLKYALYHQPQGLATMTSPPMEVEIKIRLPRQDDYDKLVSVLGNTLKSTEYQENHYFDGPNSEL
jgi:hypothetical protein